MWEETSWEVRHAGGDIVGEMPARRAPMSDTRPDLVIYGSPDTVNRKLDALFSRGQGRKP